MRSDRHKDLTRGVLVHISRHRTIGVSSETEWSYISKDESVLPLFDANIFINILVVDECCTTTLLSLVMLGFDHVYAYLMSILRTSSY